MCHEEEGSREMAGRMLRCPRWQLLPVRLAQDTLLTGEAEEGLCRHQNRALPAQAIPRAKGL